MGSLSWEHLAKLAAIKKSFPGFMEEASH